MCTVCGRRWPVADGIADFAEGRYYDDFNPGMTLAPDHLEGLRLESEGALRRMRDYYIPLITEPHARVLDCGCGNGISVDVLCDAGFDAWGNDLSALRKWQWRGRRRRDRLAVASALALPFPDGYFDVVISSGVIEHIGVEETATPRYAVGPLANRDGLRREFFRELTRVLRPGGVLFIDCPNGRFPIDFWHSDAPGHPRFHSPREPFLPSFREIEEHVRALFPDAEVSALSPHRRLQFHQASAHWYGRLLERPAAAFLKLMGRGVFRILASSPLNPFLVVRVVKPST
jgi:SAM-dependent methyltransferase